MTYVLEIETLGTLELDSFDEVVAVQRNTALLGYTVTTRYVSARSDAAKPQNAGRPTGRAR